MKHHHTHTGGRPRSRNGGFTLIESIMCLLVLAVGTLGIYQLALQVARMNEFSRQMTEATTIAELAAEDVFQTDYDNIATGDRWYGDFKRRFVVSSLDGGLSKAVTVRISWWDHENRRRKLEIKTIVSSYNPTS